jgi:hypothetical protein
VNRAPLQVIRWNPRPRGLAPSRATRSSPSQNSSTRTPCAWRRAGTGGGLDATGPGANAGVRRIDSSHSRNYGDSSNVET